MVQSPMRIVLVMFDPERRFSVKLALHHGGFEVEEAGGHKAGLWQVVEEKPDVLVVERFSPRGDDVMTRLAAMRLELNISRTTVLLVCDAQPSAQDHTLARELGSISFIVDPVDNDSIVAKVRQYSPAMPQLTPLPYNPAPQIKVEGYREPVETPTPRGRVPAGTGGLRLPSPPPGAFREERIGGESPPPKRRPLRASDGLREPSPPPRAYREERIGGESPARGRRAHRTAARERVGRKHDDEKRAPESQRPRSRPVADSDGLRSPSPPPRAFREDVLGGPSPLPARPREEQLTRPKRPAPRAAPPETDFQDIISELLEDDDEESAAQERWRRRQGWDDEGS